FTPRPPHPQMRAERSGCKTSRMCKAPRASATMRAPSFRPPAQPTHSPPANATGHPPAIAGFRAASPVDPGSAWRSRLALSLPALRVVARVGPGWRVRSPFRLAQDCGVARGERAPVAIRNGEPVVAGTELPVADIVRAAHARIVHMGPAEPAVPGIG